MNKMIPLALAASVAFGLVPIQSAMAADQKAAEKAPKNSFKADASMDEKGKVDRVRAEYERRFNKGTGHLTYEVNPQTGEQRTTGGAKVTW